MSLLCYSERGVHLTNDGIITLCAKRVIWIPPSSPPLNCITCQAVDIEPTLAALAIDSIEAVSGDDEDASSAS